MALDAKDRAILSALQDDARISHTAIGRFIEVYSTVRNEMLSSSPENWANR